MTTATATAMVKPDGLHDRPNNKVFAQISFNDAPEDEPFISGLRTRSGTTVVYYDHDTEPALTMARFKYTPPMFTSPLRTQIAYPPAMVLTIMLGGVCTCGTTIRCLACDISAYKRGPGRTFICPECGKPVEVASLPPSISGDEDTNDVLCTGAYSKEEVDGIIHCAKIMLESGEEILLPEIWVGYTDEEVSKLPGVPILIRIPGDDNYRYVKYGDVRNLYLDGNSGPSIANVLVEVGSGAGCVDPHKLVDNSRGYKFQLWGSRKV